MMENKCPECGSEDLIHDYERAEIVCGRCGLVIDEIVPDGFYSANQCDNEQKYNKVIEDSTSFALHNKGLGTNIDNENKDSQGQKIPSKNRNQFYRLRKWEMKTKVSGPYERNLSKALNEIDKYGSIMGFSKDMKEDTSMIYREALDINLVKGRGINKTVAGCLFITCRRFKAPVTIEEIAEITGISKKELGGSYRNLCRWLDIKLPLISPIDYVPKFASKLGLSDKIQAKAIEVVEKSKGVVQGNPKIIAVAALYLISDSFGENITLNKVNKVTGVAISTIKRRKEELSPFLD